MAKTAVFFRFVATVIIAVLLVGLLGYTLPKGFPMSWKKNSLDGWGDVIQGQSLSPYAEQALLQQEYADSLKRQIADSLGQLVGEQSVHASVSVQLGLVEITSRGMPHHASVRSIEQNIYAVSVVVLLDSPRDKNQIYHPLSKVQLKRYTDIVKTIIGYDAARGDKVLVLNQPFVSSWKKDMTSWINLIYKGVLITLIGLLLILLMKSISPSEKTVCHKGTLLERVKGMCLKSPVQAVDLLKRWIYAEKLEQACIIVLAIGTDEARLLFRYFKQAEIYQIIRRIRCLGKIPQKIISQTLCDFVREWHRPIDLVGSDREAQDLLHEIPNGQDMYAEILASGSYKTLWEKLSALDLETLVCFLKTESPEGIAFILFHLSDELSGKVLKQLPEIIQSRVLIHLKHMRSIGGVIRSRLMGKIARDFYRFNQTETAGMKKVSAILNTLSAQEREALNSDPKKQRIQNWQDVLCLSQKERIRLLTYLDLGALAAALSGEATDVQNLFKQILSQDQWDLITEKMKESRNKNQAREIIIKTAQELFG